MLKIAVLDDDLIFLKNFEAYLIALLSEIDDYTIQTFNDPDLFIQSNDTYDWLFLDVEIGNHNGLEIAERIKRNISEIIFVSSHSNYVFDSFKISPFSYLLKNELEMKGTTEIQRLIRKYKENQQTISIVTNQSKYKIRLNTILYFFKEDDYILVRCIKNTYKYKENLRNLVLNKDF
ncbi:MAG: response regulator, partial [Holdemanella sp.]|nr:response regulator [Holdemanella sp.]